MADASAQGTESLQAVNGRGAEADRARILVILADRRHLTDLEPKGGSLDQHLRIEDEVVAVFQEWNRFEEPPRVRAIAGVELREVQTEHAVLGCGQEAVSD